MNNTSNTDNRINEEELFRAMNCIGHSQISSPVELQRSLRVGYSRTMNILDELKRRGWISTQPSGEPYSSTPAYQAYVSQTYNPNGKCGHSEEGQLDIARVNSQASALNDVMHAACLASKNGGLTDDEKCAFQKACKILHVYMQLSSLVDKDEVLLSQIEDVYNSAEISDNGRNVDVYVAAKASLLNLRQFLAFARESIEKVELCSAESRYKNDIEEVRNWISAIDIRITAMASEWLNEKWMPNRHGSTEP